MEKYFILIICLILLTACNSKSSSTKTASIYPEIIFQSYQCATNQANPSFEVIKNQEQLKTLFKRLHRSKLETVNSLPLINFKSNNLFILEMGQKPTAGYSLKLTEDKILPKGEVVIIEVSWNIPPKDSMQAQMVTSPCLIFSLNKDDYETVTIDIPNINNQLSVSLN